MSSVVRFNITQRTAEGARVPIVDGGRVVLEPTRLIVVEGDPDEMVIPARITAPLVDGRADVLMDATGVAWCWRIVVRGARRDPIQEGYYTIPESATPLDYPTDLVEVDPKTLVPAESAVPAWEAAVEVVQSHEDAAALAAAQAAWSASSAAASAQSAANSAGDASGSAGTAATKATEASTSATNAASSASAANVSATNADAAKTAASGSATSAAANASQAANSASTASTKATEATNSATAAIASASAADASATAAASSAATASAAQAATEAVDITVGTVITGTPGTPAAAEISGDAPAFTLDLTIPRGAPGPVNSLSIGTVTTGAAGSPASANITGEAPEQVLNLTLPKGDAGGLVGAVGLDGAANVNALAPGTYHCASSMPLSTGVPFEGFRGYILAITRSDSYRMQTAYAQTGTTYVRTAINSTTWYPWTLLHTTGAVGGGDLTGTGMPNGVVAPVGTYYTDTAGTNGAWRWLKKSGTGNTGWECIVGDTGWRDVSSLITSDFVPAASGVKVRRILGTVYLDFEVAPAESLYGVQTSIRKDFWKSPPPGFIWPPPLVVDEISDYTVWLNVSNRLQLRVAAGWVSIYGGFPSTTFSSSTRFRGRISWRTDNAWPTTLPGTPA